MERQQYDGRFITIEGSEGGGKSTHMAYARALLEQQGQDVIVTREPGGTELGEAIRSLLLGHRHDGMADDTELLLMFAARNEHLTRVIRPALAQGQWVLCDRFTDATYAYQGGGRGIDTRRISALEDWVQQGLQPDLTLLLDLPVDMGLARTKKRTEGPDRFEQQQLDFFERVRSSYLRRAKEQPRFQVIDASKSIQQVQQQIGKVLATFCNTLAVKQAS